MVPLKKSNQMVTGIRLWFGIEMFKCSRVRHNFSLFFGRGSFHKISAIFSFDRTLQKLLKLEMGFLPILGGASDAETSCVTDQSLRWLVKSVSAVALQLGITQVVGSNLSIGIVFAHFQTLIFIFQSPKQGFFDKTKGFLINGIFFSQIDFIIETCQTFVKKILLQKFVFFEKPKKSL